LAVLLGVDLEAAGALLAGRLAAMLKIRPAWSRLPLFYIGPGHRD
jgi:hypothetical protein